MTELDELFQGRWTAGELVAFHSARKLLLLAHSPESYRKLGVLVAGAAGMDPAEVEERYRRGFSAALSESSSLGMNVNALQHAAGYFKKGPSEVAKHEVLDAIQEYSAGRATLDSTKAVVLRHAQLLGLTYLASQVYLHPRRE